MVQHSLPLFRSTAAWVLGETGDPRFLPALARMVREPDRKARHSAFRAISRLKRAVERSAAAQRLQVEICQVKDLAENRRLVLAVIAGGDSREFPALPPTSFILSEDSRLVAEYTVENVRSGDTIALGLLLPRSAADVVGPTVEAMLDLKRNPDRWSIAWYGAPEAPPPGEARPAAEEARPSLLLADDPTSLRKRIATPTSVFANSTTAAQVLLTSLANASGSRHLVLIEEPGEQDAGQGRLWDSVAMQAKTTEVSIHVVGDRSGSAADWCGRTGGLDVRTQYPEQLNECCPRLYLALLNRYELSYRSEAGQAKMVKLQIHSEQGCGECSFPLDGPSTGRRPVLLESQAADSAL